MENSQKHRFILAIARSLWVINWGKPSGVLLVEMKKPKEYYLKMKYKSIKNRNCLNIEKNHR